MKLPSYYKISLVFFHPLWPKGAKEKRPNRNTAYAFAYASFPSDPACMTSDMSNWLLTVLIIPKLPESAIRTLHKLSHNFLCIHSKSQEISPGFALFFPFSPISFLPLSWSNYYLSEQAYMITNTIPFFFFLKVNSRSRQYHKKCPFLGLEPQEGASPQNM